MKDNYMYLGYPEKYRASLSENIQDLKDNMPSLINWFRESSVLGWIILFSLSVCSITGIWRLNFLWTYILSCILGYSVWFLTTHRLKTRNWYKNLRKIKVVSEEVIVSESQAVRVLNGNIKIYYAADNLNVIMKIVKE